MKVCVVVTMWNFEDMTRECTSMVRANAGMEHTLLVVDNGSDKPYFDINADLVIRTNGNTGCTDAQNQGIIWCDNKYDYIMLLNNDTIPYHNFLKILVDAMENDKSLAVASSTRITKYNGVEVEEMYGVDLIRGHQQCRSDDDTEDIKYCLWVPTTAVLIRSSVIREIGLLDKRMINHCSDNDFCYRAIINDYKIACIIDSKVVHLRGVTVKKHGVVPYKDQRVMLEKLSGLQYQKILNKLPMDAESNAWGKISFVVYKK
jgi:GT2 family glycosyltransferase